MSGDAKIQGLSIAGFDPGGGAGILADLRVFQALGLYGMAVITAVTAQNTQAVAGFSHLGTDTVEAQLQSLLEDFTPAVTKTGMLATPAIASLVARHARTGVLGRLVVDPVMQSTTGAPLFDGDWSQAGRELLSACEVITPNIAEAAVLTGIEINSVEDAVRAAGRLGEMGARAVCVTGGHLPGTPVDVVLHEGETVLIEAEAGRQGEESRHHGTGCLYSAALAGFLALGDSLPVAARQAQLFVSDAINGAIEPGAGMKIPWHRKFS